MPADPPPPAFAPGFRFSPTDALALLLGAAAAAAIAAVHAGLGAAAGVAVGAFFLFCNVVRASRPAELTWATAFLALAAAAAAGRVGWPVTLLLAVAAAAGVWGYEACRPGYHGAGWWRFNPELPAWWRAHAAPVTPPTARPAPAGRTHRPDSAAPNSAATGGSRDSHTTPPPSSRRTAPRPPLTGPS